MNKRIYGGGEKARIGEVVRTGKDVRPGKDVRIGREDRIGKDTRIGKDVRISGDTRFGEKARNGTGAEKKAGAGEQKILAEGRNLRIGYGKKTVAEGIHFILHEGEILAIVGPNGSGKSTLLKSVAGFLPLLGGELLFRGVPAGQMRREDRARFLSVVTTDRPDVEWMTVWDVAASGRYPYTGKMGILSAEDKQIVIEALEWLQAADLKDRYFRELSDGQKQRVMLAKSIAQRPKLLILDEPTSYLDIRYQLEFMQIAANLAGEMGMALMMSIHELTIARHLSDRVMTLKDGRMDRIGESDLLTTEYITQLYGIPQSLTIDGLMDGI